MKVAVVLLVFLSVAGGCSYLNKRVGLSDDNIAEELLESTIEGRLGLEKGSIDLSPETPEK